MTEKGIKINTDAFKTVMEKVGDRQFVVYSINGATRTGKSYVLNYFIRYFEARKANHDLKDWINFPLDSKFTARSGRDRTTEGIDIWEDPYFITTEDGKELAIVLMDTQGLFDELTTTVQNAFIMSVSTLCSSVMVFNVMRLLNEDVLQNLDMYCNYASTVMNQDDEKEKDGPKVVLNYAEGTPVPIVEIETNKKSCQNLLFLLRDFELFEYGYGVHNDYKMPHDGQYNYFLDTFREGHTAVRRPEQNEAIRKSILSNYSEVSVFTLPDPGKKFKRQEKDDKVEPDDDFKEYLQEFIEFIVSDKNLVRKKFGDIDVTGKQFLEYVKNWAAVCEKETNNKFPKVQTIAESTAWTQHSLAHNAAFNCYKTDIYKAISDKKLGVPENKLKEYEQAARESSTLMYDSIKKIENKKFLAEFRQRLDDDRTRFFNGIQALNKKRLECKQLEPMIKEFAEAQLKLKKGHDLLAEKLRNGELKPDDDISKHMEEVNKSVMDDDILRIRLGLNDDMREMKAKIAQLKAKKDALIVKTEESLGRKIINWFKSFF